MKKWFSIWKAPPILQERQTVKSQATKKWESIPFVHDSISLSGINTGSVTMRAAKRAGNPALSPSSRLRPDRYHFYLHPRIFRQAGDFHAGARREGAAAKFGEKGFIDAVHIGEVVEVFHEDGGFHDIAHL